MSPKKVTRQNAGEPGSRNVTVFALILWAFFVIAKIVDRCLKEPIANSLVTDRDCTYLT